MPRQMTIKDVGRRAGVSIGTVSRILNGSHAPAATRAKVMKAAESLRYKPNLFAKGMRGSLKGSLGIVVAAMTMENLWLQKVLLVVASHASRMKYRVMMEFFTGGGDAVPDLMGYVDGCILVGHYSDAFFDAVARQDNTPLVTFAEKMPYENGISIQIDYRQGMRKAVAHLLALGHEEIALVNGNIQYPSMRQREEGYLAAMEEFGRLFRQELLVSVEDSSPPCRGGYQATRELMQRGSRPTAVIFAADDLALGGMQAVKDSGLQIPQDVSIVGFDDISISKQAFPSLSTVSVNYDRLAAVLIETLEKLIGNRCQAETTNVLEMELVARESIGKNAKPSASLAASRR